MKKRGRFHILKIDSISEERQGLIFYICRCYPDLPREKQRTLDALYRKIGGDHEAALRRVMETDDSFVKICREYYIASETTLARLRTRFYLAFPFDKMLS